MRLVAIPISHYCERARWALEHARIDFSEERHLQMFHRRAVKRAGGRSTTPVLVVGDGETLTDSSDIVQFADANGTRRLYPEDGDRRREIEAFEKIAAGKFGVETRRLAYYDLKDAKQLLLRTNNQGAPLYQRLMLRLGYRPAMNFVSRALRINAERVASGRPVIEAMFEDVASRLADGRRYLFGSELTAADITFAALAAPVIAPPGYGVELPSLDELPSTARANVEHFRSLPGGQFVLRVYREDR